MKKILLSILFYITLNVNLTAHVDHYKNYNYLEYELFRNDNIIKSKFFAEFCSLVESTLQNINR